MSEVQGPKRHPIRNYLIGCLATVLVLVLLGVGFVLVKTAVDDDETRREQQALDPFYQSPPDFAAAPPGAVLRKEQIDGVPAGGRGWRVLYRSERSDGTPSVSGGLVFAPGGPVQPDRNVVAWAHGTVGMGEACAPSRSFDAGRSEVPGLELFLRQGWVVAATDYTGLGTRGVEEYLVGEAEARDVVNSVRAARDLDVGAGTRVGLWGHSQGGHSVLWTQALAPDLAPELEIVGAAAAAPAAELDLLFTEQWDTVVGSLIGAEVAVAWPVTYPDAKPGPVVSGDVDAKTIAEKCIERGLVDLELRSIFGQQMFRKDPMTVPAWRDAAVANTPAPPASAAPTLVIQGLKDPVVLPPTTATFVRRACAAGSDLTALWVGDLGHMKAGIAGAPLTFTWLQDRFDGVPPSSTCGTEPPVAPLPSPRFVT